jgi:hypothetical protein
MITLPTPNPLRPKPYSYEWTRDQHEVRVLRPPVPQVTPSEENTVLDVDSPFRLYRDRTVAILRRYMRISMEVGRMPTLLGREFFRARVTSYRSHTFADAVIFVLEVEHCLEKLSPLGKTVIGMVVLQEYTHEEAAVVLGWGHRTMAREYWTAIDRVAEIFLEREILSWLPVTESNCGKSCQEGDDPEFPANDSYKTE